MIARFDVFLFIGTKNNRVNLPHHFSYFIIILNFLPLCLLMKVAGIDGFELF